MRRHGAEDPPGAKPVRALGPGERQSKDGRRSRAGSTLPVVTVNCGCSISNAAAGRKPHAGVRLRLRETLSR
jgi:hypothetical protein